MKEKDENSIGDYFSLKEVFGYFFRKDDPERPSNFNIKAMHFINKLSIAIFLIALAIWIIRRVV